MGDEKGTIYHISKVPIRDYLINWVPWALREALPQSVRLIEVGGSYCYLDIWTMPKCRTNATNVTIALPRQII